MSPHALATLLFYFAVLTALAVPLGRYMARVYAGEARVAQRIGGPLEQLLYRASGVRPDQDMTWRHYARALLAFNLLGLLVVYAIQRLQASLPLNPANLPAVPPEVAFNTAVSFASNTNWQAYGGETTMSHLTQMTALAVQSFLSAGTGMAVMVALARGFSRRSSPGVGSFWVDLTRSTLYVLLPLSILLAVALVSQGVVQTLDASFSATLVEPLTSASGAEVKEQVLAVGPAASQVAIKQLGTNGGGFFNVNSAHPFENPTPLSNFLQLISILLIPAAFCFTFGELVADRRQAIAIYSAMSLIFVCLAIVAMTAEESGNPAFRDLGHQVGTSHHLSGGNMEGKEVRFGVADSALWAVATTAASNGSVNSMHDSFTPIGGLVPMWLIQLGEVIYGGVGSGLCGFLLYAIIAVFIAGLMVGRTPEYLGKKIEASEMKMASLGVLLPSAAVLVGTAIACLVPEATGAVGNPGAHGYSEILYSFSSAANNNGSAFGGLTANGVFYTTAHGIAMLVGRYWVIVPVLALAGRLAAKRSIPESSGTLPTHGPLFIGLLVGTILLVGALTFIPALALGPVVEHLQMVGARS